MRANDKVFSGGTNGIATWLNFAHVLHFDLDEDGDGLYNLTAFLVDGSKVVFKRADSAAVGYWAHRIKEFEKRR